MRYALLIVDGETARPSPEPPPPDVAAQVMKEYSEYTQMLRDRGIYLGGEALQPNPTATTVRVQDGKRIVTDGPFIEAKEQLAGYCLFQTDTPERAVEIAARWPDARHAGVELRPLMSASGTEM
jgi:hypothetical protein